jgi:hypothetical protein
VLLLDEGVVLVVDDWLLLAAGVWLLLLFGSELGLDVWLIAIPADSSKAEHVKKTFFMVLIPLSPARLAKSRGSRGLLVTFPREPFSHLRQLEISY